MTAIELLEREIRKTEASLYYAQIKPNVSVFEIVNLQEKLRLKREILEIVRKSKE